MREKAWGLIELRPLQKHLGQLYFALGSIL